MSGSNTEKHKRCKTAKKAPTSPSLSMPIKGTSQRKGAISPSLVPSVLMSDSPAQPSHKETEMLPGFSLPPSLVENPVAAVSVPNGPQPSTSAEGGGSTGLLSGVAGLDPYEEYSKDEKMLNEFIKTHPMLRFLCPS